MSSFDSPPEYDIHLDRVKEIETACALSVEIKKQLGKLADPVIKLEDTLGDAIDTAAVERIRNNLLTLPSTYASALIPVQKFSVDLRIGCETFAKLIFMVEDADSDKDKRVQAFSQFYSRIKVDTDGLSPAIEHFKQVSDDIHQMTVDLINFITSESKTLNKKINTLEEELEEKKKTVAELEEQLNELKKSKKKDNEGRIKKLEEQIAACNKSISSGKITLEEMRKGVVGMPDWGSTFRQQAQKASETFAAGPVKMQKALGSVASQLKLDVGGIQQAIERDATITPEIVRDIQATYTNIGIVLRGFIEI